MFTFIIIAVTVIVFTAGYLCLPYAMWKKYIEEWQLLAIKIAIMLVIVIPAMFFFKWNMLPFVLGYISFDPFSYYFMNYKPRLEREKASRSFYERMSR